MSKQDEAFEKWHADKYGPRCHRIRVSDERYDIAQAAFAAGREAEREWILRTIVDVDKQLASGWHAACDEITRRIKEQEK